MLWRRQECCVNLGEQVFDHEQTPILNLTIDRDQTVFVGEVEE